MHYFVGCPQEVPMVRRVLRNVMGTLIGLAIAYAMVWWVFIRELPLPTVGIPRSAQIVNCANGECYFTVAVANQQGVVGLQLLSVRIDGSASSSGLTPLLTFVPKE